jgi:ketosteroid isomerase-like protein
MSTSEQLHELLTDLYAAFGSGDSGAWTSHLADDALGIGSDSDEWWEGGGVLAKVTTTQMAEMSSAGVTLTAGNPRVFAHGDVAWVVDRPVLHLADGSERPMRVTIIAVPDAGTLRIKHFHFSVGAVNEDVFGRELTTG